MVILHNNIFVKNIIKGQKGHLFCRHSYLSLPPPLGEGDRVAVEGARLGVASSCDDTLFLVGAGVSARPRKSGNTAFVIVK